MAMVARALAMYLICMLKEVWVRLEVVLCDGLLAVVLLLLLCC